MDNPRRALVAGCAMALTGVLANTLKPDQQKLKPTSDFDLKSIVPTAFADWQHEPSAGLALVDPQAKQLLDKIYSQMLTRVYQNGSNYRMIHMQIILIHDPFHPCS